MLIQLQLSLSNPKKIWDKNISHFVQDCCNYTMTLMIIFVYFILLYKSFHCILSVHFSISLWYCVPISPLPLPLSYAPSISFSHTLFHSHYHPPTLSPSLFLSSPGQTRLWSSQLTASCTVMPRPRRRCTTGSPSYSALRETHGSRAKNSLLEVRHYVTRSYTGQWS